MQQMELEVRDYYRYCPGEEQIKLSNAVCRGRRRVNYPKCRGCQFNDDERAAAARTAAREGGAMTTGETADAIAGVFKAYDIRGTVPSPLSDDLAWRIGHATAQYLLSRLSGMERASPAGKSLVVGRDIRPHSPALQSAFIDGARAAGLDVIDIGLIDTSQIYFAVNHLRACGGVQTTASHNPVQYNGFKICASAGKPVGAGTGLESIREITLRVPRHQTGVTAKRVETDLSGPYRAFVRGFLNVAAPGASVSPADEGLPRPLTVVVDASNGCAGHWFPILFGDVRNLTIVPLHFEHAGVFEHDPNPLIAANLADLRAAVKEHRADFGACFDGDADRCVFVDEKAEIIRSDFITALLARGFLEKSPGAAVVYDLRSSRVLKEEIERAGGVPFRQRVGHAFMKKALAENNAVFGGELSGHFYFRDNFYCDSGMLAFVHVLNLLARGPRKLGELVRPLRRLHATGEINFENPDAAGTFEALTRRYADGRIDDLDGVTVQYDDWWFNLRASNTEPLLRLNLEAGAKKLMQEKLAELEPLLGKRVAH